MGEFEDALALDLGMSRITAATAGLAQREEIGTHPFVLGHRGGGIAALAFVDDDCGILFGDAAEQRGFERPENLVRGFVADIGDETPIVLGPRSMTAAEMTARLVVWAAEHASPPPGARPAIVIAHPSSWTAHRTDSLLAALATAGIADAQVISTAEAAVIQHDAMHRAAGLEPLAEGDAVAVYDLGGDLFEATILRKDPDGGFSVLGSPVAAPGAAGALFDDLVLAHAVETSGASVPSAPTAAERVAFARLRRACIDAKESLSFDADATIPVTLPECSGSVRITRSEFEAMIDPHLERTMDALEEALDTASVRAEHLEHVLLLGGSARIPLVAQRLSERFDRPMVSAQDDAAALGAARAARRLGALSTPGHAQASSIESTTGAAMPVVPDAPEPVRRRRRLRPVFAGASLRSASPVIITVAAVIAAAGITTGTAGAAILQGVPDDPSASAEDTGGSAVLAAATDPFVEMFSGDGRLQQAVVATPALPSPALPEDEELGTDPAPAPRNLVRTPLSTSRSPASDARSDRAQRDRAPGDRARGGPKVEQADPTPRPSARPSSTPKPSQSPGPVHPAPTTGPTTNPTPSSAPTTAPTTDPTIDPTPIETSSPPTDPPQPAASDPPGDPEPPQQSPPPSDPPPPADDTPPPSSSAEPTTES